MGPLPPERVTLSPPFSFIDVDMMGPLLIKNASKDDKKRYAALFTYLVTQIYGSQRCPAENNQRQWHKLSSKRSNSPREDSPSSSEFSLFLAKHSIQWNFIPPTSPWMGGAWKRMVGTVKRALLKTIGKRKITEEIFAIFLCEIESVVNSRPLTVTENQDDIKEVLRPVDFIYKNIRHGTEVIPHEEQCQDDPPYQLEISTQLDAKKRPYSKLRSSLQGSGRNGRENTSSNCVNVMYCTAATTSLQNNHLRSVTSY
ncbi:hypothetical protein Aduo_011495 [Ancylostoma duodenale]